MIVRSVSVLAIALSTIASSLIPVTVVVPWTDADTAGHVFNALKPHVDFPIDVKFIPGEAGYEGLLQVYTSDDNSVAIGAAKSLTTRWVTGQWDLTIDDWEVFLFWIVTPVLSVKADSGIKKMADALRLMQDGELTAATSGEGTVSHDAIEALLSADRSLTAKVKHYPDGATDAINAVLEGDADIVTQTYNESVKYFESGELLPLAVFSSDADYVNETIIKPLQEYIDEPLPILNSTYGVLIPKHKKEVIKMFNDAWDDLPINIHVDGTIYSPIRGKKARHLLNNEISIAAWSLASQGKAERDPMEIGIPTPYIPNY